MSSPLEGERERERGEREEREEREERRERNSVANWHWRILYPTPPQVSGILGWVFFSVQEFRNSFLQFATLHQTSKEKKPLILASFAWEVWYMVVQSWQPWRRTRTAI